LPDLIVLDIMLPDGSGLDFLTELRESDCKIPILLLTALGETKNKITGLRAGSDDYLAKPYDYDELIARIEAILRRRTIIETKTESEPEVFEYGPLAINRIAQRVLLHGKDANIQGKEYNLLYLLAQNKNQVISAAELYEKVWGQPMGKDTKALRSAISRLRSKIAGSGYSITSEYNGGYKFEQGE